MLTPNRSSQGWPILGVDLWLDASSWVLSGPLVLQGSAAVVPLPIPGVASLRDLALFLQTFHATGLGAAPLDASPGLEVHLH